jgi:hypothetical protein
MKTKSLLFLIALCLGASLALAAWTKNSTRVWRLQADTTFASNTSATATAVRMDAFLEALVTNDSDITQAVGQDHRVKVSFDLIGAPVATTNYTAAGKTVTGVQLAALLRQVALDEATRQGIAP